MAILDAFAPPSLDTTKWTAYQQGSVALQVGFPKNGCFLLGVDEHLDHIYVESKGKITLPANNYFSIRMFYEDLHSDAEQNIRFYFGFRSVQENGLGVPLYGIDVIMLVSLGAYIFQQRVIEAGVETTSNIIEDPTMGQNGGFKIIRNGGIYSLYRYEGGWNLLTDINLGFSGAGYIRFGAYAEDATLAYFPWVAQT